MEWEITIFLKVEDVGTAAGGGGGGGGGGGAGGGTYAASSLLCLNFTSPLLLLLLLLLLLGGTTFFTAARLIFFLRCSMLPTSKLPAPEHANRSGASKDMTSMPRVIPRPTRSAY